jgi:Myb-like DNA-binding domain
MCRLQAVAIHGKKWAAVARSVPGRNDMQCRERFVNVLDPDLNPEPWTEGAVLCELRCAAADGRASREEGRSIDDKAQSAREEDSRDEALLAVPKPSLERIL